MGELIGTKGRHKGRGPDDRRSLGEQILARRNKGETMYAISAELGLSESTAYRFMKLALDARLVPTVDEFRRQMNDRLDATQQEVDKNLQIADALATQAYEAGNLSAIERALTIRQNALALQVRIDERRAKLNGLDAPIQVEATVEHVDPREAELAEMIRQMKARDADEPKEAEHDV